MPMYKKRSSQKSVPYASRKACTKKDAAQIVKRALQRNLEKKYYTVTTTETTVSTLLQGDGTNWFSLCIPSNAASVVGRIGNEIRLQKLEMRGSLHNNGTITNLVRMVIFYFKDNVTVSSASDIFLGPAVATDFAGVTGIDTMHYPLNGAKMQVLHDSVINLAKGGEFESTKVFRKTINLKNRLMKFEGNSVGVDNQDPNLYALFFAAEAGNDTGAGTTVELSHFTRVWYTDA